MDFKSFRYFVTVAEELHVGRAAEKLRIAQPALSQRIQQLEASLGVLLFTREKRRFALTSAGELFLDQARVALVQAEYAVQVARRSVTGKDRQVRLGYVESAMCGSTTRHMLGQFKEHNPFVGVELKACTITDQIAEIIEGNLDAGIVRGPLPQIPEKLQCDLIEWENLMVCLPEKHALAALASIAVQDLQSEMFVIPADAAGTDLNGYINSLSQALGFTPRGYQTASQTTAILCLVSTGFGISLLPPSLSQVCLNGVVFRPLRQPIASHVYLLSRTDERRPMVSAFLRECRSALAQSEQAIEQFSKAG